MTRLSRSALLEVPVPAAFAVVADVESYPEFVPACDAVEVLERQSGGVLARVAVSGMGLSETFVTQNALNPPGEITMRLERGPFQTLEGRWSFTPIGDVGCRIELVLNYVPKGVLAKLLSGMADSVANKLVDAFCERILAVHSGGD